MPWWKVKDSIWFHFAISKILQPVGNWERAEARARVREESQTRYAWEVGPEFLFCVWHAVRILLVQGPGCHLAELMVSSPLLFADAVVRTSVKWQCFCTVLAKPGLQDEKSFWWHVWDADFCFLIALHPPAIPNSTTPYYPTSFFISDPHILQIKLQVSIILWKTRKDKTADRSSWAQSSGPWGAHLGVCWFHF